MKTAFVFLLLCFFSCKQEYPHDGDCDLAYIDGYVFIGDINYCNATGSQQKFINARATISVSDSLFIINIVDIDSLYDYTLTDTALVECVYHEGHENYDLYPPLNHPGDYIGNLSHNGFYLHWNIYKEPCIENTFFEGERE